MGEKILVLLQKTESPFRQLVDEALRRKGGVKIFRRDAPPLPLTAFGPQALVLWDINGFGRKELGDTAAELRAGEAGVVILCKAWDESCEQLLRWLKVLEFVAAPDSVSCLADALDSAWFFRGRLWSLKAECQDLARQLSDRRIIDEAKWFLMRHKDLTEAEALRLMQRDSRKTNQKLALVAKNILAGYEMLADQINHHRKNSTRVKRKKKEK